MTDQWYVSGNHTEAQAVSVCLQAAWRRASGGAAADAAGGGCAARAAVPPRRRPRAVRVCVLGLLRSLRHSFPYLPYGRTFHRDVNTS